MLSFKSFPLEEIENTEPGKKEYAVVIGRMQPPTIAHKKIIEDALKKYKNVLVGVIKGRKPSPKSPFPVDLIVKILKDIFDGKVDIQVFERGFIGDIVYYLRTQKDGEPVVLFCGTDRVKTYSDQIKRYKDRFKLNIKVKEIKRSGEDVSATKVREAIKNNDKETFQKMVPEEEWKYFDELRKYL